MLSKIPEITDSMSPEARAFFTEARKAVESLKMTAIAASQNTNPDEPFLDLGAVIEDAYLKGLTNSALGGPVAMKYLH